jgi:hypothetical protein
MKVSDPENYVCPYCAARQSWKTPDPIGAHVDCEGCGKEFVCWAETDTTYFTRDLKGGKMVRDVLAQGKD